MGNGRYAILSVSDKTGIETAGRGLADLGFKLLSTGGTSKALSSAGIPNIPISDYTGFPEILDGRVKTLHPKIHGGILARSTEAHIRELSKIDGSLIDVVAVNLYPFERFACIPSSSLPELIEQIDIGGVTLIRAAAKNYERVTVVCDSRDYDEVLWHLARSGEVPLDMRFSLALKAFSHTATYDTKIAKALGRFDAEAGCRKSGAK